jgi:L-asparaginase II
MLALAKMQNQSLNDYLEPEHPVQKQILQTFSEMCMLAPEEVILGIDGCSAPNFAVPLFRAAWGLARLADPRDLPDERAKACRTIIASITSHPKMISGTGRFDTRLIKVGGGKLFIKGGAEGYLGIGVMPGVRNPQSPGLGIVLKVSDGDGQKRARPAVALEILKQLDLLSASQLEELSSFGPGTIIKNRRELVVGEGKPVFSLNIAAR